MPPLPAFEGIPRGWFMLQDLVNALPLSIFALLVRMKCRCDPLEELLRDPVEHLLLTMCALGLVRVAPNPDPKRYPMAGAQFFFLMRGGSLRDTSTSARGYSCVTPPIDQYQIYDYTFESLQDIRLYWHHFRAIVQSTPLAFRLGVPVEDSTPARLKKYAIGVTDKADMMKRFDDLSVRADPLMPHDGCAGFDSALFVNKMDEAVLRQCHGSLSTESKKIRLRSVRVEAKKTPGHKRSKKRPMDSVDLVSEQRRIHMRSRFTAKERDMLVLIRAVGFFLNPVYRFWLDPTVLRDVMHEYVPGYSVWHHKREFDAFMGMVVLNRSCSTL
uniref:Uncharacterized protein n=1 Tax=Parascaris equorum TaxID=6256 RepID=A0A914RZE1_PAREQ